MLSGLLARQPQDRRKESRTRGYLPCFSQRQKDFQRFYAIRVARHGKRDKSGLTLFMQSVEYLVIRSILTPYFVCFRSQSGGFSDFFGCLPGRPFLQKGPPRPHPKNSQFMGHYTAQQPRGGLLGAAPVATQSELGTSIRLVSQSVPEILAMRSNAP